MNSDKEQEYLKVCNECEILRLEISRAHKALNEKKSALFTLDMKRKQLRTQLIGLLEEPSTAPDITAYGGGTNYKPKSFA